MKEVKKSAYRRFRMMSPVRRWRARPGRWHRGEPHHEAVCSYEEWLAAQPRKERKRIMRVR